MENMSEISDILNGASHYSRFEALIAKFARTFYYNKKKIPMIIYILLCIVGGIFYAFSMEFLSSLLITIGASCLITHLSHFFDKD